VAEELPLTVDVEVLAVAHLLADDGVAAIVGEKVGTELDAPLTLPRIRLFLVSQTAAAPRGLLQVARLQVEAWAASRDAAHDLAAAARRSLLLADTVDHELGRVGGTEDGLLPHYEPDPDTADPRWLFETVLYVLPPSG
jgi:hypothetical protein